MLDNFDLTMNYELESTKIFDKWFRNFKDKSNRSKVLARLDRVKQGNFGDYKQLTQDLFELRFVIGGGLRI